MLTQCTLNTSCNRPKIGVSGLVLFIFGFCSMAQASDTQTKIDQTPQKMTLEERVSKAQQTLRTLLLS